MFPPSPPSYLPLPIRYQHEGRVYAYEIIAWVGGGGSWNYLHPRIYSVFKHTQSRSHCITTACQIMDGYTVCKVDEDDFPSSSPVAQERYPPTDATGELASNEVMTELGLWQVQKNVRTIFSFSYWRSLLNRVPDYNFIIQQKRLDEHQAFVLYETANEQSARDAYYNLIKTLEPLVDDCTLWLTGELLENLIDVKAYEDPSPTKLAHVIPEIIHSNPDAHPDWPAVFRSLVLGAVSKDDDETLDSELLKKGGDDLTVSALSSAAKSKSGKSFQKIMSMLSPEQKESFLNKPGSDGRSAVENAFEKDSESAVAEIVNSRVDISKPAAKGLNPLHFAAKANSGKSISAVSRKKRGFLQARSVDSVQNRQLRTALNAFDEDGLTPLMLSCQSGYVESALSLLLAGADPNIQQPVSNDSALHFAARQGNAVLVKLLLLKGGNVSAKNKAGQLPLDVAKAAGAKRCCKILQNVMDLEEEAKDYLNADESKPFTPLPVPEGSEFLLSIDGGGSRSVLACLTLIALQKRMKQLSPDCKQVQYYFDVIAGTSGGGMNTLGLTHAKADPELLLDLCLKISDEFLVGSPTDVKAPKVVVTTTIADVNPPKLHLNCNYGEARNGQKPPSEWRVWEVSRATSAAPYYFPPFEDRFEDGGVMANNPTLTAMVELFEQGEREGKKVKLGLVCSLGTGRPKPTEVEDVAIRLPGFSNFGQTVRSLVGITDTISGAVNFVNMLLSESTVADGAEIAKAKAWCGSLGVPYFRLSPVLSKAYSLAENDHVQIIHLMFEGHCFLLKRDTAEMIDTIARYLLTRGPTV